MDQVTVRGTVTPLNEAGIAVEAFADEGVGFVGEGGGLVADLAEGA